MSSSDPFPLPLSPAPPAPDWRVTLLIARRGALEALRDRMTVLMSLIFALALPLALILSTIRPISQSSSPDRLSTEANILAIYLLIIGLMPSTAAVGIASGQFAGEKEQGSLTPLLASPASNSAIFGGKVLGSILPPLLFSVVAEATYLAGLAVFTGGHTIRLLPASLSLAMVALVPAATLFAATIASLISSRVRTFNSAQQLSGLALLPLWGAVTLFAFRLNNLSNLGLLAVVLGFFVLDLVLVRLAAGTWRREEVLARQ